MTELQDIEDADERKVIAVDFDKTLTTGEGPEFWEDDEQEYPNEDVIEWVNEKYHDGHVIIVWTARPWSQAATVESYLVKWEVEYHGIRCNKTGADLYLDDKAQNRDSVEVLRAYEEAFENSEEIADDIEEELEDESKPILGQDPDGRHRGEVVFYNDTGGYGFIEDPDVDEDVFFHDPSFSVKEGDIVSYEVEYVEKGPRAEKMSLYLG